MRLDRLVILALATLATLGYCFLVWYGIGIFLALLPAGALESLPRLSALTVRPWLDPPWHAVQWQLLAIGSWGFAAWRSARSGTPAHDRSAWVLHLYVLASLFFWNAVGCVMAFVPTSWVLAPIP